MIFSDEVIEQLLKGVHPSRVKRDPSGMSYLEQHDVRAHLNRLFGFGSWSHEVTRLDLVFEQPTVINDKATGKPKPNRWDVCYSSSVRLMVKGKGDGPSLILETGGVLGEAAKDRLRQCFDEWRQTFPTQCVYEDAATGYAQNQTRGEAHDLALKSAVSTALKRAATSLGDQFGLSLYAGTTEPIVRGVLGWNPPAAAEKSPEAGDA